MICTKLLENLCGEPMGVGHNTAAMIRHGAKKDTDDTVLKPKLFLDWTGQHKILAVGPAEATNTPDRRPMVTILLSLDLSEDVPGAD